MKSRICEKDREILKRLAADYAKIAALGQHDLTRNLWEACNDLHPVRPMVYLYQVCWHEMNVDGELDCLCENGFARELEWDLRKKLYCWKHMPVDMVFENVIYSPLAVKVSPILEVREDTLGSSDDGAILSHHYQPQISCEEDISKIKIPEVFHDTAESAERLGMCREIFGDIIRVEQRGPAHFRLSIWDRLVEWTGVQEIMMDLILRPDYVHQLAQRTFDAYNSVLDRYIELGVIAAGNSGLITGDGGLGYTQGLPQKSAPVTQNLWGAAADQILGEVSPEMHEEFALKYNYHWHKRFGLNYYGCCEPLHNKIETIRKNIPNLRKVSCSPWADVALTAAECRNQLVVSIKPNPAVLAGDVFSLEQAGKDLKERIAPACDCAVEIVLKDISTVRNDPQRLWDWAKMALDVAREAEN